MSREDGPGPVRDDDITSCDNRIRPQGGSSGEGINACHLKISMVLWILDNQGDELFSFVSITDAKKPKYLLSHTLLQLMGKPCDYVSL